MSDEWRGDADISECGAYRYTLTRRAWEYPFRGWMTFVMLNPSTATATEDDPTIRRCCTFADREGHDLLVVNLFALRATDPRALLEHADPIGPLNDHYLAEARDKSSILVAAWGAFAHEHFPERVAAVRALLGPRTMCLGRTKAGAPRHPLYLRRDAALEGAPDASVAE